MVAKHDRTPVRTASHIEQKYDLGKETSALSVAADAQRTAERASNAVDALDKRVDALEEGGISGEDGATFTPSVDTEGNLSWTNDKGLENPETVNIKGVDGQDGEDGSNGKSAYAYAQEAGYTGTEEEFAEQLASGGSSGGVDLSAVYPVGSIYMSVLETNPSTLFGFGTWAQIAQGRTLFGAGTLNDTEYVAGEEIEAGLPNITGSFQIRHVNGASNVHTNTDGAITATKNGGDQTWSNGIALTANSNTIDKVSFDASASSPIYGNSDTVQPPALVVYIWQRTA